MSELVYMALASLDGYIADPEGNFDWARPDEEVHTLVNDLEREVGTMLLGRGMYETLSYWETAETQGQPPYIEDFAGIWRAADKVVYSRTLEQAPTARTRIEREFDPEAVRDMKAAAERGLSIGGPTLAAEAFRSGLVDELQLVLNPVIVGAGKAALPAEVRLGLALRQERRCGNGAVLLRYRCSD
jgi:dihydrofolate reductase